MTATDKTNGQTGATTKKPPIDEPPVIEWSAKDLKREVSWPLVLFYIHLNILGFYGVIVLFSHTSLLTIVFSKCRCDLIGLWFNYSSLAATVLTILGIIGVTCGAHRLWSHRTYTATTGLRVFLMLCQTMAGQVRTVCVRGRLELHIDGGTLELTLDPRFNYSSLECKLRHGKGKVELLGYGQLISISRRVTVTKSFRS